jgi:hypothetical protein
MKRDLGNSSCQDGHDFSEPKVANANKRHWASDVLEIGYVIRNLMQATWRTTYYYVERYDLAMTSDWSTHVTPVYFDLLWMWVRQIDAGLAWGRVPTALNLAQNLVPTAEE